MKPHEAWLIKARHDLKSARILFSAEEAILDTAVYHAQQCAEKALKAFLAFTKQPLSKTHDLSTLVDLCVEIDPAFDELYDLVEELNPYSIIFRYPGDVMEPNKNETAEAIRISENVLNFITSKIAD